MFFFNFLLALYMATTFSLSFDETPISLSGGQSKFETLAHFNLSHHKLLKIDSQLTFNFQLPNKQKIDFQFKTKFQSNKTNLFKYFNRTMALVKFTQFTLVVNSNLEFGIFNRWIFFLNNFYFLDLNNGPWHSKPPQWYKNLCKFKFFNHFMNRCEMDILGNGTLEMKILDQFSQKKKTLNSLCLGSIEKHWNKSTLDQLSDETTMEKFNYEAINLESTTIKSTKFKNSNKNKIRFSCLVLFC